MPARLQVFDRLGHSKIGGVGMTKAKTGRISKSQRLSRKAMAKSSKTTASQKTNLLALPPPPAVHEDDLAWLDHLECVGWP